VSPDRAGADPDLVVRHRAEQRDRQAQRDGERVVARKGVAAALELGGVGAPCQDRSDEAVKTGDIEEKRVVDLTREEYDPGRRISGNDWRWGGAREVRDRSRCVEARAIGQADGRRLRVAAGDTLP
jgi:hypothetical protein